MLDLLLQIDQFDVLEELLDMVFTFLTSPTKTIRKACKLQGITTDIEFTVRELATTIRRHYLRELTDEELRTRFAHLPAELQKLAICTIKGRQEEVIAAQIEEVNARTDPVMTSFDWDIRWIMGTSSLPNQKTQIANLVLNCRQPNGEETPLHVELRRDDVEKMINLLESSS